MNKHDVCVYKYIETDFDMFFFVPKKEPVDVTRGREIDRCVKERERKRPSECVNLTLKNDKVKKCRFEKLLSVQFDM